MTIGSNRTRPPELPVSAGGSPNGAQRGQDSVTTRSPKRRGGTAGSRAKPGAASQYRRHVVQVSKFSGYLLVPVIILALLAAGAIMFKLRHGPIALDELVPPLERGINSQFADSLVKIAGAELRWGASGLEFWLRNINVLENDGTTVTISPQAAIGVSLGALVRGQIVPSRVELIDPVIHLVYTERDGLALERAGSPGDGQYREARSGASENVGSPKEINLAKILSKSSKRARRGVSATSYLTEFAVSSATIYLDYEGRRSSWRVPEASINFNHARRRSIISGEAQITSNRGPWALSFVTDENEHNKSIDVKVDVRGLVPAALGHAAPPFAMLAMFEAPVSGNATVQLGSKGDIRRSDLAVELGPGRVRHPELDDSLKVTGGLFRATYDGDTRRWALQPSPIKWADGRLVLSGDAQDVSVGDGQSTWRFRVNGQDGLIDGAEFDVPAIKIDKWVLNGSLVPQRGRVEVSDFVVASGDASLQMRGVTQSEGRKQSTFLGLRMSPMPLDKLKALWPRVLAPDSRKWVGNNVKAAQFNGMTLQVLSGDFIEPDKRLPGMKRLVNGSMTFGPSAFSIMHNVTPIQTKGGELHIRDNKLELTMADGSISVSGKGEIPLKNIKLISDDVGPKRPLGQINFETKSDLAPFLAVLEQLPLAAVEQARPFPEVGDGKIVTDMQIHMPLSEDVASHEIRFIGKAHISEGRFGKVAGKYNVQGFTLNLDLTETKATADGNLIVNGVPAKISGERIFASSVQQPPIVIKANLDKQDRKQLGMDVESFVEGVVPLEVSLSDIKTESPTVELKADLTKSRLLLDGISWEKAAGQKAVLRAKLRRSQKYDSLLDDLKIDGSDIAVKGWIGLDKNKDPVAFCLPRVVLGVVSRFEISGRRDADEIWRLNVKSPRFDGRNFFRDLFKVGDGRRRGGAKKNAALVVVKGEFDSILGHSDTSLRKVKVDMARRGDELTAFEMRGELSTDGVVAAQLDRASGKRRLRVESRDAGDMMRLIGFYPNMQGGNLKLEVNLDGEGAAEKSGLLWVENFRVLGDPVVSEVVSSADQGRPAIGGKRVTRQVFQFDQLRAPFSVGFGQFVLDDSYVRGPLAGGTLRGKVDFNVRRVNLGGTYIPLQGLNSALGAIPVLGQLITGVQGEGIFGMTFAVQGRMENPQVIVNPLSMVAPGIFREIFQMTAPNPKVQARGGGGQDTRPTSGQPSQLDGWSSTTDAQ